MTKGRGDPTAPPDTPELKKANWKILRNFKKAKILVLKYALVNWSGLIMDQFYTLSCV